VLEGISPFFLTVLTTSPPLAADIQP